MDVGREREKMLVVDMLSPSNNTLLFLFEKNEDLLGNPCKNTDNKMKLYATIHLVTKINLLGQF